jgi:hypothetical protein
MAVSNDQGVVDTSGFGEDSSKFIALLNLKKAVKLKRRQHLGIVWKSRECLIAVRRKKPINNKVLKQLKRGLPEKAQRGASRIAGFFQALSRSSIVFAFQESADYPSIAVIRKSFKKQIGFSVQIKIKTFIKDPKELDSDSESNKKGT